MLVELLGTAHAARVLASLDRLGGRARFTPLRDAAGIGDQQLSRALRYLNGQGLVAAEVVADGERAPMEYAVSRLGTQALDVLRAWHQVVHGGATEAARVTDAELQAIVGE